MRNTLRWGIGIVAALVFMSSTVKAEDLKSELADLKAKVAAMEAREMAPAAGGDAASLTSLKGKGQVKIGGTVEIPVVVTSRDEDPTQANGEDDVVSSTVFRAEAALYFDVQASKNTKLRIKLDLEDFWNEAADQDDLLEECYFTWTNVLGSSFNVAFGKKELAFGQDKEIGAGIGSMAEPFVHGRAMLFDASEAQDTAAENPTNDNNHNDVGTPNWIGEIDNVFQIEASYAYKDLLKATVAVFQSRTTDGNGRMTRGMHEDRSDDTLFFQSFAGKLEVTPLKNLALELSFVNEHNDTQGDEDLNGKHAEDDRQALSFGFVWSQPNKLPFEVFGEYIHGWNYAFSDSADNDIFQLGMNWFVTKNITFGIMGEYAEIDWDANEVANGAWTDEDYWNFHTAIAYEFDSGVTLTLEYVHQWFDGERKGVGNGDLDADADAVIFTAGWSF